MRKRRVATPVGAPEDCWSSLYFFSVDLAASVYLRIAEIFLSTEEAVTKKSLRTTGLNSYIINNTIYVASLIESSTKTNLIKIIITVKTT